MTSPSKVALVIIHWNNRSLLEKFLPSVVANSQDDARIYVADNASTDDSVAWLQEHYPQIHIIALPQNYGYAGGYNEALKHLEEEYFILLNNDVEVPPHWIKPLIQNLENNPKAAAAQPKILQYAHRNMFEYAGAGGGFIDKLGYPFCRGRLFESTEEDFGQYNDNREIFWASGACLFVRAKAFKEVGGFDAHFFAHMEEIDLCWRMQLMGYTIHYVGNSEVYHLGGSTLQKSNPKKTYLNFRNSLQMILKNADSGQLWWFIPLRSTLDLMSSIFFLMNAKTSDSAAVHRAHAHFFFKWNKWWKLRKEVKRNITHVQLHGVYPGSVVFEHFIGKKKTFSQLKHLKQIAS
jgi:GT2 family glycosyltransferase